MKLVRSLRAVILAIGAVALMGFSLTSSAAESPANPVVKPAAVTAPININTADAHALAALNGVGDKKAEDIVAYRQANGKFNKVEDLLNVKGIGEKTLEKNRQRLSVN